MAELAGKHALVTGGGTGIGMGIARQLLKAGATVTISGRREDVLLDAKKHFEDNGTDANSIRVAVCDVTSPDQVRASVKKASNTDGALNPILKDIVSAIKKALENTPPELSADLVDMGLTLTGGGSLLNNIDKRFSKETGLPVNVADDPLSCVAIGTGKALDQEETFSSVLSEY